jgi:hypothetical protein
MLRGSGSEQSGEYIKFHIFVIETDRDWEAEHDCEPRNRRTVQSPLTENVLG